MSTSSSTSASQQEGSVAAIHCAESSDVDRVLNRAGFTRFTLGVCALCGFGWFADGVEYQVLSFMIPTLEEEWGLRPTQLASLASAVALGQALGAVFWGAISDARGRRPALWREAGEEVAAPKGARARLAESAHDRFVVRSGAAMGLFLICGWMNDIVIHPAGVK